MLMLWSYMFQKQFYMNICQMVAHSSFCWGEGLTEMSLNNDKSMFRLNIQIIKIYLKMQILSDGSYRKRSLSTSYNPQFIKSALRIQKAWRAYQSLKMMKKRIKKLKSKSQIAKELLTSERTYVENLSFIINDVVVPSKSLIDDKQIHQLLFSNLEEICSMHKNFLTALEQVMKDYSHHKTRISTIIYSQLFAKENFKLCYSNYCANYKKSNEMAKLLFANNSGFKNLLRKAGIQQSTALESYLIKPMQRLCKYELLLNNYFKNMENDHEDYFDLQKTIAYVENLVKETNQQVQEFLMDEKYRDLLYEYQDVFKKIPNPERKLLFSLQDISLIDLINDESSQFKQLNLFNDTILLIPVSSSKPIYSSFSFYRDLPNLKYFKNLVQIIHLDRYLTIEFKKEKHKQMFNQALKKTIISNKNSQFIEVSILGTQIRTSLFKNYTVYIAQIKFTDEKIRKIYPRFKDMLRVQEIIQNKKIKLTLPSLSKETYFVTNKSKTIEKRKLIIQECLEKILNCKECYQLSQIFKVLNLKLDQNGMKAQSEVIVSLPSSQVVKVMIDVKNSTIKQLKENVAQVLGLIYCSQFQIYQIKNKMTRLMDEDEAVLQIYENQTGFSFNPFKQNIIYVYTRNHYIDPQDEFTLYKNDFMRTQLELSVIKSQILKYRLEQELMITFMCLFAIYINVPVQDDSKLSAYIKDIGKKQYKVSKEQFRTYYTEVEKKVTEEEDEMVTLPFLIIKIISNSPLYRCRQFEVSIHPKSFKAVKGYIPGLQQKIVLGIKSSHALLLTQESKHIVQSFSMDMIQVAQIHPTSIILQITNIGPLLRLDTQHAFQISKLFDIYKTKI